MFDRTVICWSTCLLDCLPVHVVGDLQLGQVRQLAPVAQHDLHVAPHRTGPAAAVPPTAQLAPPPAHTHSRCYGVSFGGNLGTAAQDWSCSACRSTAGTTPCITHSQLLLLRPLGSTSVQVRVQGPWGSVQLSSSFKGLGVRSTQLRVQGPGGQINSVQGAGFLGLNTLGKGVSSCKMALTDSNKQKFATVAAALQLIIAGVITTTTTAVTSVTIGSIWITL